MFCGFHKANNLAIILTVSVLSNVTCSTSIGPNADTIMKICSFAAELELSDELSKMKTDGNF